MGGAVGPAVRVTPPSPGHPSDSLDTAGSDHVSQPAPPSRLSPPLPPSAPVPPAPAQVRGAAVAVGSGRRPAAHAAGLPPPPPRHRGAFRAGPSRPSCPEPSRPEPARTDPGRARRPSKPPSAGQLPRRVVTATVTRMGTRHPSESPSDGPVRVARPNHRAAPLACPSRSESIARLSGPVQRPVRACLAGPCSLPGRNQPPGSNMKC